MRFRSGLSMFNRTNSRGLWNIAAFHSPHSLTWRWILSFGLFRNDEGRVWPLWGHHGSYWMLRLPFIGILSFQTQRPMWYRDLYRRRRDEDDEARYAESSWIYERTRAAQQSEPRASLH